MKEAIYKTGLFSNATPTLLDTVVLKKTSVMTFIHNCYM